MKENKLGIDETMDVIAFAQSVVADMVAAKADDGELSTGEMIQAAMKNAPSGLRAFAGSSDIDNELSDLTEEERERVVKEAMKVVQTFSQLFY